MREKIDPAFLEKYAWHYVALDRNDRTLSLAHAERGENLVNQCDRHGLDRKSYVVSRISGRHRIQEITL